MTIRRCKPSDRDPDRPADEQVWCLFSKDEGKLLGRHPTKEKAEKQERAIQIQKARAKGHKIPKASSWVRVASGDSDLSKAFFAFADKLGARLGFEVEKFRVQRINASKVALKVPEDSREMYGMGNDDTIHIDCFESQKGSASLRVYTNDTESRVFASVNEGSYKITRKDDAEDGLIKLTAMFASALSKEVREVNDVAAAVRNAATELSKLAAPAWGPDRVSNIADELLAGAKTLQARVDYARRVDDDGKWLRDAALTEIKRLKRTLELAERGLEKSKD